MFALPSAGRWLGRLVKALIVSIKIAAGAVGWEGFALLALSLGFTSSSAAYFLLSGLGDAVGYFLAHVVIMHLNCIPFGSPEYTAELHGGILLAVASGIVAGTMWGVWEWLLGADYLALSFAAAFFAMFALALIVFFCTLLLLQYANASLLSPESRLQWGEPSARWQYDLSLSFSVAAADAFFLSTSSSAFSDPGELYVFDVSASTPVSAALGYSAATALIGFLSAQLLQNSFLAYTWLDEAAAPPGLEQLVDIDDKCSRAVGKKHDDGQTIDRDGGADGGSKGEQETLL